MDPQHNDSTDTNQTTTKNDEIFVLKPEPKEPVSKKTVWLTIGLAVLGIVVLIVVFMLAIIGFAGSLADDYRQLASVQVQKVNAPLKDLEPSRGLNNRNIEPAINKIYISKQSQPSLENTLFVGDLSSKYVTAKKQQISTIAYYKDLDLYTTQLEQLIKFDDAVEKISVQEIDVVSKANPNDSLNLRSVAGNHKDFAEQIEKIPTPAQLKKLQKDLVKSYQARADIYTKWALAIESGDKSVIGTLQTQLQVLKAKAATQVTDKNLVVLFTPSYAKLAAQQKALETALSN